MMVTMDFVLDMVMQLPDQQKQTLLDILWRRQIKERREEMAAIVPHCPAAHPADESAGTE